MLPQFDEKKATQVAGVFLALRNQGGRMSYMKLIKLMYLTDREALMRWGWSMTGDEYVSMEHGQVLSKTYDLLKEASLGRSYWRNFISPPNTRKEVKLLKPTETGELSRADRELIEEIFSRYGQMDRWELANITHGLPEYRETNGPSLPVGYADVLLKAKRASAEEVEKTLKELHTLAIMQSLTVS
jgi:uncharacterized phage-associated protein